jgi:hypothetical protein
MVAETLKVYILDPGSKTTVVSSTVSKLEILSGLGWRREMNFVSSGNGSRARKFPRGRAR